jgi:hypothetical protein
VPWPAPPSTRRVGGLNDARCLLLHHSRCGAGHVTPLTPYTWQYSRACSGASSSRDSGGENPQSTMVSRVSRSSHFLCHEIRLAPARGTRTHTRTTRRKVNTRPRAVKRSANIGVARVGRDIALLLFAAGIAEGAQDWLSIAPPPQSTVKSVTWSTLDRHQASPFELLPFPLVFLLLLCRLSLPGPIVKHFLTML